MFSNEEFDKRRKRFKKMIWSGSIAVFILIVASYGAIDYLVSSEFEENGGVKKTLIKYGKEIKEINDAINADGKLSVVFTTDI